VLIGLGKLIDYIAKTPANLITIIKEYSQDTSKNQIINSNSGREVKIKDYGLPEVLLDNIELPYLNNLPIIDKGIYLQFDYNDLHIGGVNIDTIKINARAKNGEPLKIRKSDNLIELDLTKEPFIEFEYKGVNYSLETSGQQYSFYCTLRKNVSITMRLRDFSSI
jgi:hypothetical protein